MNSKHQKPNPTHVQATEMSGQFSKQEKHINEGKMFVIIIYQGNVN